MLMCIYIIIINVYTCIMQVKVQNLQPRCSHSANAFSLSPGLTEVTLFGGYSELPSNFKYDAGITPIANTTVLRFGEYTSFGVWVMHVFLSSFNSRHMH